MRGLGKTLKITLQFQRMFCPKCGKMLIAWEGTLYCQTGDMPLSGYLRDSLSARFAKDSPSQSEMPEFRQQFHGGLRWFCPGCGNLLNKVVACYGCGEHLRDLVYPLIELHPHR